MARHIWPDPAEKPVTTRRRWLRTIEIMVLVVAMLVAAAAAFAKPHPIPPRGTEFTCTAIAVWDGDGPIWCAEGPRIRLAGINARELDGSCRKGARCVAASGIAARDALVELLGGAKGVMRSGHIQIKAVRLACRSLGPDRFRRTLAQCLNRTLALGSALIRMGVVSR